MNILRQPTILCIHVNRVSYTDTGHEILNSAKVDFPSEFAFSQILSEPQDVGEDTIYRLAAVIEHIGYTPRSGHYMAYKRLFPDNIEEAEDKKLSTKWLKVNDERITVIEEADLLNRKGSVYLLFY